MGDWQCRRGERKVTFGDTATATATATGTATGSAAITAGADAVPAAAAILAPFLPILR